MLPEEEFVGTHMLMELFTSPLVWGLVGRGGGWGSGRSLFADVVLSIHGFAPTYVVCWLDSK